MPVESIIFFLFLHLINISISVLCGAILLRASAKWFAKTVIPFYRAIEIMFIASMINLIVTLVIISSIEQLGWYIVLFMFMMPFTLFILPVSGIPIGILITIIILIFLVQSIIFKWQLKIPFGKASIISGGIFLIILAIWLVILLCIHFMH